eukprot:scaffold2470_cov21-Tisochrysis_lutea.AAC.2
MLWGSCTSVLASVCASPVLFGFGVVRPASLQLGHHLVFSACWGLISSILSQALTDHVWRAWRSA